VLAHDAGPVELDEQPAQLPDLLGPKLVLPLPFDPADGGADVLGGRAAALRPS
jgi:hypothetical protein